MQSNLELEDKVLQKATSSLKWATPGSGTR